MWERSLTEHRASSPAADLDDEALRLRREQLQVPELQSLDLDRLAQLHDDPGPDDGGRGVNTQGAGCEDMGQGANTRYDDYWQISNDSHTR